MGEYKITTKYLEKRKENVIMSIKNSNIPMKASTPTTLEEE
jgi:hypothetical protein